MILWMAMLGGTFIGCATTKTFSIEHYPSICAGEGVYLCPTVDEGDGYGPLYTGIHGFEPEWGTRYRLEVKETEIDDQPADGSSRRLELVRVVESSAVDPATSFELRIDPGRVDVQFVSSGGIILDRLAFVCANPEVCASLEHHVRLGSATVLTLVRRGADHEFELLSFE